MLRFACFCLAAVTQVGAATYYLDSVHGNDAQPGTAAKSAWKTLAKINATELRPGDRVLFRSGDRWQGALIPRGSGAPAAPIVISRFGAGPLPRLDGNGEVPDTIRLYNVEGIELRNLEVTNRGAVPAARRAVHISLDNFGVARHIVVSGLYIHDVNGDNAHDNSGKDNGGIIFRTNGDRKPSRFDGLIIERNIVWKVDRSAIAAQSFHFRRNQWFPSTHVVIRDNFVEDIGGDGIVPWATDHALIEHNIALHCNRRAASYNAGIWPWSTDDSLFQLNEAAFTHTTLDGQGFDSDFNSRRTVFQYNYSHDNEGGFLLICNPGNFKPADNIGNLDTIARFNISNNDHNRIFHLSAAAHTLVTDNAIFTPADEDIQLLITTNWEGWAEGATFSNNSFFVRGTAHYGHEVSRQKDGRYLLAPGWGPAKDIRFSGNHYYGKNIDKPADPTGAESPASEIPAFDPREPRFDPAHPEQFPAFLSRHRQWIVRLMRKQFGGPLKLGA